jgi:SNF2 family DNA or RNA helicase
MLKNKASKRTLSLIPILQSTKRCVLLSGTPALARPSELWPQLLIIGTEQHGWGDDEEAFMEKYGKPGQSNLLAELHTMLTGTVMIRRLKSDMLKSLPRKIREKAELHILTSDQRNVFRGLMAELRQGRGALGKLARDEHVAKPPNSTETTEEESRVTNAALSIGQACAGVAPEDTPTDIAAHQFAAAKADLEALFQQKFQDGLDRIERQLSPYIHQVSAERYTQKLEQMKRDFVQRLENERNDAVRRVFADHSGVPSVLNVPEPESRRTTLLSRLYELSGKAKIPLVVDMLKRWLNDPLKGKLCIFAHHISVLDALLSLSNLSNGKRSSTKYIRIDGSTSPKQRQLQIKAFQTDPSIRIALLGITAAGVAVTLTASSTVWFAELFWTPAIMIQAEDR